MEHPPLTAGRARHPQDLAGPRTPVARSPADVARLAASAPSLAELSARSTVCRACPRLVAWREEVARTRRAAFRAESYWGRPVSGWGAEQPRVLLVGLAPAAHGGNRTGRVFTGDRSGDFLFAALHRAGLAVLATSTRAGDGQELLDTRLTLGVRCAPPGNTPTPAERDACAPWLAAELRAVLPALRVVVVLGGWAWRALPAALLAAGVAVPRLPAFGHGVEAVLSPAAPGGPVLLGCYHPSQQNTSTGLLTTAMLDQVLNRAVALRDLVHPIG